MAAEGYAVLVEMHAEVADPCAWRQPVDLATEHVFRAEGMCDWPYQAFERERREPELGLARTRTDGESATVKPELGVAACER